MVAFSLSVTAGRICGTPRSNSPEGTPSRAALSRGRRHHTDALDEQHQHEDGLTQNVLDDAAAHAHAGCRAAALRGRCHDERKRPDASTSFGGSCSTRARHARAKPTHEFIERRSHAKSPLVCIASRSALTARSTVIATAGLLAAWDPGVDPSARRPKYLRSRRGTNGGRVRECRRCGLGGRWPSSSGLKIYRKWRILQRCRLGQCSCGLLRFGGRTSTGCWEHPLEVHRRQLRTPVLPAGMPAAQSTLTSSLAATCTTSASAATCIASASPSHAATLVAPEPVAAVPTAALATAATATFPTAATSLALGRGTPGAAIRAHPRFLFWPRLPDDPTSRRRYGVAPRHCFLPALAVSRWRLVERRGWRRGRG
jgi:hypothetical protein